MPTILRRLPTSYPDSVGLPSIAPTDDELALYNDATLLRWWRADTGLSTAGWRCRKTDSLLLPASAGILPTVQTIAAYNSKESLLFGPSGAQGVMYQDGIVPLAGGFTFVVIGRPATATNSYLVGTGDNPSGSTPTFIQAQEAAGTVFFEVGGYIGTSNGADLHHYADGPMLLVASHSDVNNINSLRVNRGRSVRTSPASANTEPTSSKLVVGGAGTPGSTLVGMLTTGDIGEVMLFNFPLHEDATKLALVESVVGTRYGITAP